MPDMIRCNVCGVRIQHATACRAVDMLPSTGTHMLLTPLCLSCAAFYSERNRLNRIRPSGIGSKYYISPDVEFSLCPSQ